MKQHDVSTASTEVLNTEIKRKLPRTLMGGTAAMQQEGENYLPREDAESALSYNSRLKRSTLFNCFGETIKDFVGRVFERPVVYKEDIPEMILGWLSNIDLSGQTLGVFAKEVFKTALVDGISYIMVDMPPASEGVRTLADDKREGRRPWFVHIRPCNVLGWRKKVINGHEKLTMFRFRDDQIVEQGLFDETTIKQVKVLRWSEEATTWESWRQDDKGEWFIFDSGIISLKYIPVFPAYINRSGFMNGEPPLMDLAELNRHHWQSSSDQRNILHIARVPILFWAGYTEGDETVEIGAGRMMASTDSSASLSYVEHSGAAIAAGDKDLENIENQMQSLGMDMITEKTSGDSATGSAIDASKVVAPLAAMAEAMEDCINNCLKAMADYSNLPDGGSIGLNKDYVIAMSNDANTVIAVRSGKIISNATTIRELQRRNVLSSAIDPEEETIAVLNEAMVDESADQEDDRSV